eukprot:COSAG06_NODE_8567_length_2128_cov_1.419418_1_plen_132_part_00
MVGLLIAYMFDLTNVREGSLIVIWITMLGVGLALFILTALILGNNFYLLFLLGVMDVLIFLTGAWATLQFRWLQKDSPSVCLVLEKLLLGCLPVRDRYIAPTHHTRAFCQSRQHSSTGAALLGGLRDTFSC